jgi:hypothetical protein
MIDIAMTPMTYDPMEGILVDVSRSHPMDRYTWAYD